MRRTLSFMILGTLLWATSSLAQTLSSRPGFFTDPLLAVDRSYGELVLGRTTLRSAMLMFATELEDATHSRASTDSEPAVAPRARYRLTPGRGHYTLYFDKNERLIAAIADRQEFPRPLRRDELVAQYATLRPSSRQHLGSPGAVEDLEAPLGPCLSMQASVWTEGSPSSDRLRVGTVLSFGYRYTCPTKAAELRADLPDLLH
jgi:hypothetical protein